MIKTNNPHDSDITLSGEEFAQFFVDGGPDVDHMAIDVIARLDYHRTTLRMAARGDDPDWKTHYAINLSHHEKEIIEPFYVDHNFEFTYKTRGEALFDATVPHNGLYVATKKGWVPHMTNGEPLPQGWDTNLPKIHNFGMFNQSIYHTMDTILRAGSKLEGFLESFKTFDCTRDLFHKGEGYVN